MKALTLHQPWASLIAVGVKTVETRSWHTSHRGPLAIHAGKRPEDLVERQRFSEHLPLTLGPLPLGAVVAVCDLEGWMPVEKLEPDEFGDYSPGRFGWLLDADTIRAAPKPIPCLGRQGLWTLPDGVADTVAAMEHSIGRLD